MRVAGDYLPRRAAELIRDALEDTRVVVVTGARPGLVLYCGTQQLSFGEALSCLPISALWTAPESA